MVNYSDLGLKNASSPKTIKIGEKEVKVLQYLPAADKYDLVNITTQQAVDNGVVNPFLLDMYFHLNIIFMYTDIIFTDEDRLDLFALYDQLTTNDVINLVVAAMNEDEYSELFAMVEDLSEATAAHNESIAGIIAGLLQTLPEQAAKLQEAIESIDSEKITHFTEIMKNKD